jgi:hypothetical protein
MPAIRGSCAARYCYLPCQVLLPLTSVTTVISGRKIVSSLWARSFVTVQFQSPCPDWRGTTTIDLPQSFQITGVANCCLCVKPRLAAASAFS